MHREPFSALLGRRAPAQPRPVQPEKPIAPLDRATFAGVVANAPLIAVDLIIDNGSGKILLGLRRNAPARNYWFVPGGRIYKDETLRDAFLRISHAETGAEFTLQDAVFKGVFEHFYDDNFAGDPAFGTHYLTLAYGMQASPDIRKLPPAQHTEYRWVSISELLTLRDVHPNTKAYFI